MQWIARSLSRTCARSNPNLPENKCRARPAPIPLPADYRQNYILYAIVDRADNVTRKLYTSSAAIDAVRAGLPFPEDTQFVIEAYDDALDANGQPMHDAQGHLVAGAFVPEVHTSELRSDCKRDAQVSGSDFWRTAKRRGRVAQGDGELKAEIEMRSDAAVESDTGSHQHGGSLRRRLIQVNLAAVEKRAQPHEHRLGAVHHAKIQIR